MMRTDKHDEWASNCCDAHPQHEYWWDGDYSMPPIGYCSKCKTGTVFQVIDESKLDEESK